ncbi:hypothetical protein [Mesorhizobium abyssinicae]|uniref:hypothetical protein n=1 Tax=Mesorhizobium abyssinicae TaxID=1209958 RepID=UPI003397AA65
MPDAVHLGIPKAIKGVEAHKLIVSVKLGEDLLLTIIPDPAEAFQSREVEILASSRNSLGVAVKDETQVIRRKAAIASVRIIGLSPMSCFEFDAHELYARIDTAILAKSVSGGSTMKVQWTGERMNFRAFSSTLEVEQMLLRNES